MGVVKRQGTKDSILALFGIFVGYANVMLIQPYCLKPEEIALIRVLIQLAMLIVPFILIGSNTVVIRYFPYYNNKQQQHNGFVFFSLMIPLIGFLIASILFLSFQDKILMQYIEKSPLLTEYLIYSLPIALFIAYSYVLNAISRSVYRVVIPNFLINTAPRLGIIIAIGLYYFQHITQLQMVQALIIIYSIILVFLLVYVHHLGHLFLRPNWQIFKPKFLKEIAVYGFYVVLGGFASTMIVSIDIMMLAALLGLEKTGIYTIAFFIGTVIDVPRRSLSSIVTPLIADAWKNNNLLKIKELYIKISINQLIIGSWIFLGIWLNIDDLFKLIHNGEIYQAGKYVVFFIGISKIIDMSAGVNSEIIFTSIYYRFNFHISLILVILTIATNYMLIPLYGIVGAAMATAFSVFLFNVIKFLFIWFKFKLQPFSSKTLISIFISLVCYLLVFYMPTISGFLPTTFPSIGLVLADILQRSVVLTILFFTLTFSTKISKDLNDMSYKLLQFFMQIFR
ncbi:MAG: polysaccharide biosynthesis C-terminal domain-containing protein [Chitinophagales bacterium]